MTVIFISCTKYLYKKCLVFTGELTSEVKRKEASGWTRPACMA
jgi:hypothetical protein